MNIKKSIRTIIEESIKNGISPREALKSAIEALIEIPEIAEERICFIEIDEDKAVSFEILSKKRNEMLKDFEDKPNPVLSVFSKEIH